MWPIPDDTVSIPVPPTSMKWPLTCGNAGQGRSYWDLCAFCSRRYPADIPHKGSQSTPECVQGCHVPVLDDLEKVGVPIPGHPDGGVPESGLDALEAHACLDAQGHVGVPEVVETGVVRNGEHRHRPNEGLPDSAAPGSSQPGRPTGSATSTRPAPTTRPRRPRALPSSGSRSTCSRRSPSPAPAGSTPACAPLTSPRPSWPTSCR
jgi:hypothetical protein